MTLFTAKTFHRNEYVKIKVAFGDKRVKTYYGVPKGNILTVSGKSFTIDQQFAVFENRVPTYYFNFESTNPLDFYNFIKSDFSPENVAGALRTKIFQDFFEQVDGKGMDLKLVLSFIILVGILAIIGLLLFQIQGLTDRISELETLIKLILGV